MINEEIKTKPLTEDVKLVKRLNNLRKKVRLLSLKSSKTEEIHKLELEMLHILSELAACEKNVTV